MSQADATSSTFVVDPDDDATYNSKTFSVRFPSPELIEVREAIAAFRAVEMTDAADPLEHAMDLAILKFLTRPPLRMRDVLEAIEVIARDNCWFTTHAEDVPSGLDAFVGALNAVTNRLAV